MIFARRTASGKWSRLAVLGALLGWPFQGIQGTDAMAADGKNVFGWVEIQPTPQRTDMVTISGHVLGLSAAEGRFSLIIGRVGPGNTSNNRQEGNFKIAAGESKKLSTTSINIPATDSLSVELRLVGDGKELFTVMLKPGKDSTP
jgi:hypothetical protein